jgi:hypothetical protein
VRGPRLEVARDVDAPRYVELFLVYAVAALLVIRAYLELTGYPRLGGGAVHIAHMLWGGLLLVVALLLILGFLGKQAKLAAAILGGLGFGTFIDELGKFVTSDNDYFFRPTIGLIYVIFVVLFLISQEVWGRGRRLSPAEYVANAADMTRELVLGGARPAEVTRALWLLERGDAPPAVADALRAVIETVPPIEPARASWPTRIERAVRHAYWWLLERPWFMRALIVVFLVRGASQLVLAGGAVAESSGAGGDLATGALGQLAASAVAAALALAGVARLPSSRPAAYHWFKRSVLVSILFVEVFAFFELGLAALGGLALDLALLWALNFALRAETLWRASQRLAIPVR